MPKFTECAGGYEDPKLAAIADRVGEGPEDKFTHSLGKWLQDRSAKRVLAIFAGGASDELNLANYGLSELVVSDAPTGVAFARRNQEARGLHNVTCRVLEFPLDPEPNDLGTFDAIVCLGVSYFHLPGPEARARTFAQLFSLLNPGGWLFIDNKNWTDALQEKRDPIDLYPLRPEGKCEEILGVTYEYPRVGEQIYHLQLLSRPQPTADRLNPGPFTTKDLCRWRLVGYPVHSTTLLLEMRAAGFVEREICDKEAWPEPGMGIEAYYHLVLGRKPARNSPGE